MAAPPLLTLSDIALGFGGDPLFAGLSLAIQPGDRVCLVGRNGSGKSTLLKVMSGDIQPESGERFARPGVSIARLPQHPDASGFATLADYVADAAPEESRHLAEAAMDGLGVPASASPATASGGELRRAALARIVAQAPDLILLDEPTNHLDIAAIEWAEDWLRRSRSAFVLISHDRAFLRALATSTLWLDRGEARRLPKGFDAFEDWRDKAYQEEEAQRHKLDRLIKAESRWAVEGISARRKRNMGRVRRLQDLRAERSAQRSRTGTAAMALEGGPRSGRLVAECEEVSKSLGGRTLLKDFSVRIMRGERVAIVGPNGAGKTTLLRILMGETAADSGTVRRGVNLVPAIFDQARSALDPERSLWETLTHDPGMAVSGKSDQVMVRGRPRHVVGYLKDFLFDETQARGPVKALSGGEKARLLLARIMARESNLLVLDEPTNDLDIETLDLLQELVAEFDGTVLMVSHDRDFLDRTATTTIAMDGSGGATAYAGGWTDHLAQKAEAGGAPSPAKRAGGPRSERQARPEAAPRKLTFAQTRRLAALPDEIARLEAEIARLTEFLSGAAIYETAPAKAARAAEGLAQRQRMLSSVEEEWLTLEELREALAG